MAQRPHVVDKQGAHLRRRLRYEALENLAQTLLLLGAIQRLTYHTFGDIIWTKLRTDTLSAPTFSEHKLFS
jgi:hypothetical protein